jgi:potassium/hydrogen antiporter
MEPTGGYQRGRSAVNEVSDFGEIVLVVSVALLLALFSSRLTTRLRIPVAAVLLIGAAIASDIAPRLGNTVSIHDVTRIGVVALIVILFDGGMHLGWRPVRRSIGPILGLGVLGTLMTAGLMAAAAHYLVGFDWVPAAVIGTALSPTDPAVMFSVLGDRSPRGRVSTILAAESGANDPVGIALMIGVIEAVQHPGHSYLLVAADVGWELLVGVVVGVAGAFVTVKLLRWLVRPVDALDPISALAAAGVIYGIGSVLHGSGFLAVFVAGMIIGDRATEHGDDVRTFHNQLASVAELVVFVALGLTVSLSTLDLGTVIVDGLVLGAVLILIARPVAVAVLLAPADLNRGEKTFIAWLGLRGAVPILLAAFALDEGVQQGAVVYGIVFVIVTASVLIQGSLIEWVARRTGVGIGAPEPRPDAQPL